MHATACQGCASSSHFGCPILSPRHEQIHLMEATCSLDTELYAFQKKVAEKFWDLSTAGNDDLLSIAWVRKLLRVFLCCQEEFRVILFNKSSTVGKSPTDRLLAEFFERSVKALDVCNAVRDGIEQIRQCRNLLEIVLCALDNNNQRSLGEGQFRRAKKALTDLPIALLDEKVSGKAQPYRYLSFGRNNASPKDNHRRKSLFRSLSWSVSQSLSGSVSKSWSAARQLQAIGNNVTAPRANEITATNGLAVAFFTMSSVLLLVMWALVAAIPCQDRGLHLHFSIPRQFMWAAPMLSLHDRILEESKKKERRNASGLLKEVLQIERCSRLTNELVDSVRFPLTEEKKREARQRVKEVGLVFEALKEGLDPLERQVREVFHKIVRSRTEGLSSFGITDQNDVMCGWAADCVRLFDA